MGLICSICGGDGPFYPRNQRRCKKCWIAYVRQRQEHDPQHLQKMRDWRRANKDKTAARDRQRTRNLTPEQRTLRNRKTANLKKARRKWKVKFLLEKQRGFCACCRSKFRKFEVDHIIARARGGGNELSNLQLLCCDCNRKKHAKHPVQFMQEMGFLL